jgi:hypothetical protein
MSKKSTNLGRDCAERDTENLGPKRQGVDWAE